MIKNILDPMKLIILIGNSSKAKKVLNWKPKTSIYELIAEMMENDLKFFKKN